MADQHNDNIPAVGNTIVADIADIKENLEYHKDCFEAICEGWSNTVTTNLKVDVLKAIAWTAMDPLTNSWANHGTGYQSAAYTKDVEGFVHLRGLITTGTAGTSCFALPAAYRPTAKVRMVTFTYGIAGTEVSSVEIGTDGTITPIYIGSTYVSLDGLSFHAS
jgi:hypothetical protein